MEIPKHILSTIKNWRSEKAIKNASWLFIDKVFRQGLNFLLTSYIARYLGVDQFGLWNYGIAIVVLFSFFSTLGIYNQLIRDFIKHPQKRNELLGNAFILKFIGGVLTVLFSIITINFFVTEREVMRLIVPLVAIGYVVQSFDVIDFFFQSQLKSKWIAISRITAFLIGAILKISFIYYQLPLLFFVIVQIAELGLASFFLILLFNKNYASIFTWKIDFNTAKSMLSESLPILLAEVAIIIYMRIDQVMIGYLMGSKTVGLYAASVRLSELWYAFPAIICSSAFPSIIKAHHLNPISYEIKLKKLYKILAIVSFAISIMVTIFASHIIDALFGEEYRGAVSILTIQVWTNVFVFVGYASNQQLVVEELGKISFYRTFTGAIINIILNFALIPIYGPEGAAIATLISQAFANFFSTYFFRSSRHVFRLTVGALNPLEYLKKYNA